VDPLGVHPAGDDDLDPLEAVPVERLSHLPDQSVVHPARVEVAQLVPQRLVDEGAGRIEPDAPEPVAQRACNLEGSPDRVVLEVDERDDVHLWVHVLRELRRGEHGVPAV
jgi:hypothetical protein